MVKRLVVAGLWFFAALYAGSMLHAITGLHELVGVAVAVGSAAVILAGPLYGTAGARLPVAIAAEPRIWSTDVQSESTTSS
jgi:hypothetical protein